MSIFVNPAQFAPSEDFCSYPRSFEADAALFAAAESDLIFAPSVEAMYGAGFATTITLAGPRRGLGRSFPANSFCRRRNHRRKTPQPVPPGCRDFWRKGLSAAQGRNANGPRSRFRDRNSRLPTVRDADGLALSSRNVFLSAKERALALSLYAALRRCAHDISGGVAIRLRSMPPGQASRRPASSRIISRPVMPKPWPPSRRAAKDRFGFSPPQGSARRGSSTISRYRPAIRQDN